MSENKKFEESVDFVTAHYRDGDFLPQEGWKKFIRIHRASHFRRNIAAACIEAIVLTAAASILYYTTTHHQPEPTQAETTVVEQSSTPVYNPEKVLKIEFTDASLKSVVEKIETEYGVHVTNVPDEEIRLTISYEGDAEDVVATINELLDINLKIEKPDTETSK